MCAAAANRNTTTINKDKDADKEPEEVYLDALKGAVYQYIHGWYLL